MLAELLANEHQGRIVTVTCVRRRKDLGYLETYRELEGRYHQFRYLFCTTREPENLDPSLPNFRPKRYLQDYFTSGEFEEDAKLTLNPDTCHVFLCGNPAMIGAPKPGPQGTIPTTPPNGMVSALEQRGFTVGAPDRTANIHYEKYW